MIALVNIVLVDTFPYQSTNSYLHIAYDTYTTHRSIADFRYLHPKLGSDGGSYIDSCRPGQRARSIGFRLVRRLDPMYTIRR